MTLIFAYVLGLRQTVPYIMQENDKQLSFTTPTPKKNDLLIQELTEKLSALEHDQWVQYSKSVYKQIKQSASREDLLKKASDKWSSKWKPYDLLTESEKDKDRIWATMGRELYCAEY